MALCWLNMCLLLALAADRLPLAQRLVDGLFPTGDGYAARLTLGRRAQLGDEMVYRSTVGSSPAGPHVEAVAFPQRAACCHCYRSKQT